MQAIRTIQKPTSDSLTITIPEEFINQELEIIILVSNESDSNLKWKYLIQENTASFQDSKNDSKEHTERYLIAQQYKGDALFPDFPTDELNVYEQ